MKSLQILISLLFTGAFFSACATKPTQTEAPMPILGTEAYYVVPTDSGSWPGASSEIQKASYSFDGKKLKVEFMAPMDLAGSASFLIQLEGVKKKSNFIEVTGFKTTGRCLVKSQNLTCLLDYEKLDLDVASISKELTERYAKNATMANHKVSTMKRFSGEPLGVLVIDSKFKK